MEKTKTLVERYLPGLEIFQRQSAFTPSLVSVNALEIELSKAILVNGVFDSLENSSACASITVAKGPQDTHQGLLLGYQSIKEEKGFTFIALDSMPKNEVHFTLNGKVIGKFRFSND